MESHSHTIYDAGWHHPPGAAPLMPTPGPHPQSRLRLILLGFLRGIGSGLVILTFANLILIFAPILVQEVTYQTQGQPTPIPSSGFGQLLDTISAQKIHQAAEDAARYGVTTDFSLVIPKISAKSQVTPNVDPADETAYLEALKKGIAHAAGTKFPGQPGTTYLFAHSTNAAFNVTRYNAIFYLLKELEVGDDIIIFFAGQEYKYKVSNRLTTEANDTSWLVDIAGQERLVLQTCWPPGTTFKRLIIIAHPI